MNRRGFLALAAAAVPTRRAGKPEVAYKSPGPHPNGLQATAEGLWVMDQGNNRVILVSPQKKILFEYGPTSGPVPSIAPTARSCCQTARS